MSIAAARAVEHEKYTRSYTEKFYRMGAKRMRDAVLDLQELPCRGSYLDVSCGRAEMLSHADALGYKSALGTEIVPALIEQDRVVRAEVHVLPFQDKSFDVVSMFDVIEHLLDGDDELACLQLMRVARKHILITANNRRSVNKSGDDLHINKRPYDEWDGLFRAWFKPHKVIWIRNRVYVSEGWRIDLQ